MTTKNLLENLRTDLEWAEANEWESPIGLADDLRECIKKLENLWTIAPGDEICGGGGSAWEREYYTPTGRMTTTSDYHGEGK